MRTTDESNLPPQHLLKALRPRQFQGFAATRTTTRELAARISQLQAEYLGFPRGSGSPPPELLDALRECSPELLGRDEHHKHARALGPWPADGEEIIVLDDAKVFY